MTKVLAEDELVDLVFRIFQHNGMSAENAAIIARNCVGAERDGALSHGLFRVDGYVSDLRSGWVDGRARPEVDAESIPAVVMVDARNGFAQVALEYAKPHAIEKTRRNGVCIISIRDSHHFAALWPDVEPFAREGLVALAFANSIARVVPWGGRVPVYGTNPMALGVPREGDDPLVFDQASSAVAFGEVLMAAQSGEAVPLGIGVDRGGAPTTDPSTIINGGALLPFGGHKGSSIAMMVEILCAALTGGSMSYEVDLSRYRGAQTPRTGELLILIHPRSTGARSFTERIEALVRKIKESGQSRLPSERRYRNRRAAAQNGIRVDEAQFQKLEALLA